MTNDLLTHPLWQECDLGKPLPDSPHAVSVALPLWRHVIGYEERAPEIINALQTGYPRFVVQAAVRALFAECERRFARPGETCFAFPSLRAAERCAAFLLEKAGAVARIEPFGVADIQAVVLDAAHFDAAKKCWQHYGEIVSSRRAEAALSGQTLATSNAKDVLQERIAAWTGGVAPDVYLYPSGMAAIAHAVQVAQARQPGCKSAQLGFPYVDVLKVQYVQGPGVHLFAKGIQPDLDSLEDALDRGRLSCVVCEFPGNPLLQCTEMARLSEMLRAHEVPLIIDDTTATFANAGLLPYADILATSLTKAFSGTGDVIAGSLVLNSQSPLYGVLKEVLINDYEDLFFEGDAQALEANSRDFGERVARMNAGAAALCEFLEQHRAVEQVYYPKITGRENFDAVRKENGGYGGLFSVALRDESWAPRVYDALRVTKGPSLGNNFTLACPYVLLAHYDELDWVRSCGVSPNLIRVSVGLEPVEDLIERFASALDACE